ncbi:hypothetical protein AN216_24310 [Streptomyces oceani]|uniref:histidine kinase n=1 Tax=Streptomyces oceani TaxID=1075402 RepID=A0A1E7JVD0_9ACTN|nr:hypothetical protein AN216_24310 [Streptomyces oceani]
MATLPAVLVTASLCLLAASLAPESARTGVAWGGGAAAVALCVAVAYAAHHRLVARQLRDALTEEQIKAASGRAATQHFAEVTVPALVERLREGASAESALAAEPAGDEQQRRTLHLLATEIHRSESVRAAAMAACANAAGRVQAMTTSMAADLRDMEHRHADQDVLGDLLHLDHRTAQTGRLADCIAVLTGARSGRRWAKPIVMESILRGAMGRISGYQRMRLHSTSSVAIAGHAAEGVMHALAELMDNAANFSPPTSEVHVYVEEVSAGIVVTIEDGGLVMGDVALKRAERAVSPIDWELPSHSGTRLGLPVVGRLARKHGLHVSFRPSAHGGTGVLLRVPQELIVHSWPQSDAPAAGAPTLEAVVQPAATPAPAAPAPAPAPAVTEVRVPPVPGEAALVPEEGSAPADSVPAESAPAGSADPADDLAASSPFAVPAQPGLEERRTEAEPSHPAERPTKDRQTLAFPAVAPEAHGQPADPGATAGSTDPAPAPTDTPSAEPAPEHSGMVEYGESGLPKRQRGRTLAEARRPNSAARAAARANQPARDPSQSGSRFGAFRRAVRDPQAEGTDNTPPASPAQSPAPPTHASSRPEDDSE